MYIGSIGVVRNVLAAFRGVVIEGSRGIGQKTRINSSEQMERSLRHGKGTITAVTFFIIIGFGEGVKNMCNTEIGNVMCKGSPQWYLVTKRIFYICLPLLPIYSRA